MKTTGFLNALSTYLKAFKDHPKSVGQSYFQHFQFSANMSLSLLGASLTALTHAVVPPLCQTSTSQSINKLHALMQRQKNRKNEE